MKKILITGATDGIGLEAARRLVAGGHHLLIHGRDPDKLERVQAELAGGGPVESYRADLSRPAEVEAFARDVLQVHPALDVLINNAGVFAVAQPGTPDGLDVRFAVNTVAPYILTRRLLGALGANGRVVNVSSAAQSPVDLTALKGGGRLPDMAAYAQSKLALGMWSFALTGEHPDGPMIVLVNPGSMLGTKMVREAFGQAGRSIAIGAEILERAALDDEFKQASGRYYDNDAGRFGDPHPDTRDPILAREIVGAIEGILKRVAE